jgi:hypothetical protein
MEAHKHICDIGRPRQTMLETEYSILKAWPSSSFGLPQPRRRAEGSPSGSCKLGLEVIVSKREESPYRSGRSPGLAQKTPTHRQCSARPRKTGANRSGDDQSGPRVAYPQARLSLSSFRRFRRADNGEVVGRIFKVNAAPAGYPWMWTLAFGHYEDRMPRHGYAATRDAAMLAFAKRRLRE